MNEITIHKKNEIIRGKPIDENLSLEAKRCLNTVYYIVQKSINNNENNEKKFQLSFQEFKKLMGITDNNYIYIIRNAIKELQRPFQLYNYKISTNEKVLWHSTVFISDFKIIEKNKEKIVHFELNSTIYDLIKETGNFTELEFKTIQKFKTKYSSILYEYLKSYSNLSKLKLSLEMLNSIFITNYEYLSDVKKVLNRILKEFENTDLSNLTFETDKKDKSILFHFDKIDSIKAQKKQQNKIIKSNYVKKQKKENSNSKTRKKKEIVETIIDVDIIAEKIKNKNK